MTYPKSLFRNDGGNWVAREAHNAEEESSLKASGYSDLLTNEAKAKPTPFFPPVAEKAKTAK